MQIDETPANSENNNTCAADKRRNAAINSHNTTEWKNALRVSQMSTDTDVSWDTKKRDCDQDGCGRTMFYIQSMAVAAKVTEADFLSVVLENTLKHKFLYLF